jgi:hypothetical protein
MIKQSIRRSRDIYSLTAQQHKARYCRAVVLIVSRMH